MTPFQCAGFTITSVAHLEEIDKGFDSIELKEAKEIMCYDPPQTI